MNLWEDLIRGIYAYGKSGLTPLPLPDWDTPHVQYTCVLTFCCLGFERPSAIQQRATKPIVNGHDVITQAQSGTDKTATISFAIMLQSVDMQLRDTQALCLLPTRELAVQIQMVCVECRVFFTLFVVTMLCNTECNKNYKYNKSK